MPRIRIVHIINKLELNSAALSTLYAARHLNRSLFDVTVIAGPGGALDEEVRQPPDLEVQYCGELSRAVRPLADYAAYQELRDNLREIRPEIVHTHGAKAGVVGRLAASAAGVPVVLHTYHEFAFHPYQSEGVFRLSVALEREASRRTNHLIFVSEATRKWAEELDLVQNCSCSLIRTGIEIEPLLKPRETGEENSLLIAAKEKAVAMIASLKPQKDPITFVEVADLVTRKKSHVKFFMIGDGELAGAVIERGSKIRHYRNFLHLGWKREISDIFRSIDLLVVPSLWECGPRVIAEATVAGVPVVASDIDGIREMVFEGRNGALATPRDPQNFADKILQALRRRWSVDPQLSREMQHQYDIREMLRKQEELYLELTASFQRPQQQTLKTLRGGAPS